MSHLASESDSHLTRPSNPGNAMQTTTENRQLLPATAEQVNFETFLANLSATFVNVPAAEVDSQIELGLKQIVEFLDLDRSGFGEVAPQGMVITHSYQRPGVPPSPRVILDQMFPVYARKVQRGDVFRMPEDLPPEAASEWVFCEQTGLKSNLTIPLKVAGSVVGGIGFASFRAPRDWPEELIQRLRMVGDIFTNALARKRADEALQRANEQTRILLEELAHATRQELVSYLTSSIAHEVNQPLCAIASNAQSAIDLFERGDFDEVKNALRDICDDAKRGSDVIARIRSMVKKESPCRDSVRLATVVEELTPLLRREAASRRVELRFNFSEDNLMVLCDRVQLQQVVLNLFLNSLDAVSNEVVRSPEVCIQVRSENTSWVQTSIFDNGVGLSVQDRQRVFEPMFTTKAKGLGMGLSISRSIIESHGGKIWACEKAINGTAFHFQLPALHPVMR